MAICNGCRGTRFGRCLKCRLVLHHHDIANTFFDVEVVIGAMGHRSGAIECRLIDLNASFIGAHIVGSGHIDGI